MGGVMRRMFARVDADNVFVDDAPSRAARDRSLILPRKFAECRCLPCC
jgi:hypothetical protein